MKTVLVKIIYFSGHFGVTVLLYCETDETSLNPQVVKMLNAKMNWMGIKFDV